MKILSKIFIGYLIVLSLLSGMILFFSFDSIRTHYINYLISDLEKYSEIMVPSIKPYVVNSKSDSLDTYVKSIGREINTRITIIDLKGKVLADSQKDPETMENHLHRPEIQQAFKNENGVSIRHSATVKMDMLYVAIPIKENNQLISFLRLSLYITDINNLIDDLEIKIINITLIVVGISLIIIFIFSRKLTNPLKKLVAAAKRVAGGDFKTKVFLKNKDEMKNLADSFNYMTEHINSLFCQLTYEKEKLGGFIKSLNEGFIVLDSDGKIVLANAAFSNLCNSNDVIDKYYWELIEDSNFKNFIKTMEIKKDYYSQEVPLNDKTYIISSNYLESGSQYVITLYDISQLKQLEQIKKDFVVNVSHELRTPLTAIKGFIETIEDEAEDPEQLHYLNIIHRHTNRLINIVNDLLLLSNLEQTGLKIVPSKLDFNKFLDDLLSLFDQKLKEKEIGIEINIDENLGLIDADSFKLEQLFINLIDNAIKYTDQGSIKINIAKKDTICEITIADTGIGIGKEQLERIFERFYVIDKSRSRKVGGTGLGLSIVKHIVMLHKGDLKVESAPSKGTKFIIHIPISQFDTQD